MSLEADEEAKLVRHAVNTGWLAMKINILGHRGWPDRLFIGPRGLTVWIEMKKKGQKPRKLQSFRIQQLENYGHRVGWFDNAQDACNFLDAARLSATCD